MWISESKLETLISNAVYDLKLKTELLETALAKVQRDLTILNCDHPIEKSELVRCNPRDRSKPPNGYSIECKACSDISYHDGPSEFAQIKLVEAQLAKMKNSIKESG